MMVRSDWLEEVSLQQLFAATRAAGGEARAVGGAVRDALMGRSGGDVDVASSLLPEQTMALAAQQGWKAIPTGLAHGTVTLVLPERVVEVTTLRRDVATDGRHAEVAFTDSFEEDARRRDFTINALYLDAEGTLYDYVGGVDDLAARRVRFIGDASVRIREDGLRMLRFFRFLATHGSAPADAEALAAIARAKGMIDALSGERIAAEMKKLLQAEAPFAALELTAECGLSPLLTQAEWDMARAARLVQHEVQQSVRANGWARLMALVAPEARGDVARFVGERWKLSRVEREQLVVMSRPIAVIPAKAGILIGAAGEDSRLRGNDGDRLGGEPSIDAQAVDAAVVKEWMRAHSREMVQSLLLLAAADEVLGAPLEVLLTLAREWVVPKFPVKAADLLARGFVQGAALGAALKQLELRWVASDYQLEKASLLSSVAG